MPVAVSPISEPLLLPASLSTPTDAMSSKAHEKVSLPGYISHLSELPSGIVLVMLDFLQCYAKFVVLEIEKLSSTHVASNVIFVESVADLASSYLSCCNFLP